jgi:hypothetical protein
MIARRAKAFVKDARPINRPPGGVTFYFKGVGYPSAAWV